MFEKFVYIFLISSAFAFQDYDEYRSPYEDYTDDDVSNGDDYVYNKTDKAKPKRIYVNDNETINIEINDGDGVTTGGNADKAKIYSNATQPSRPRRDCNFTSTNERHNRAQDHGGDDITTYPFVASVLRMGSHYASGALIDKRWVLTAAGVFYNVRESIKLFRVRLGSINCKRGGVLTPIQQIVINPSYMLGKPDNDLAMLRLAQPLTFTDTIRSVSLTDRKGKIEINKFLTMYWPRLLIDGVALPASAKERQQHTSMRVSTQRVMPWKQCWRALSYRLQELTQNSFCLRPLKHFHTFCLADVGAPVLSQDGLWGIISGWVGDPCTLQDLSPILVTRVTPPDIRYWIEAQFEIEE